MQWRAPGLIVSTESGVWDSWTILKKSCCPSILGIITWTKTSVPEVSCPSSKVSERDSIIELEISSNYVILVWWILVIHPRQRVCVPSHFVRWYFAACHILLTLVCMTPITSVDMGSRIPGYWSCTGLLRGPGLTLHTFFTRLWMVRELLKEFTSFHNL